MTEAMIKIHCDGAVMDNPYGPGGWAFVVWRGAEIVHRAHGPLEGCSNNEAEYMAIIQALKWLSESTPKVTAATIYSDSMLAINQISGEWNCNAEHLAQMRDQCTSLAAQLGIPLSFEWVPRSDNIEADAEAARGVAEALGVDEEEAQWLLAAYRRKYRWQKVNEKASKHLSRTCSRFIPKKDQKKLDEKRRRRLRH